MLKIDAEKIKKLDNAFQAFKIGLRSLGKKRLKLMRRVIQRIETEELQNQKYYL